MSPAQKHTGKIIKSSGEKPGHCPGSFSRENFGNSACQEQMKVFYKGQYPKDHWALQPYQLEDPKVVGIACYENSQYAIYMNPTDSRGYRCIVCLVNNEDMLSTFNREYSAREHMGLAIVVELVERAYRQIVPIVQTYKLGNNSQGFDPGTRTIQVGKEEEPGILHTHIAGRGDPEKDYVEGVKLGGPVPGVIFDIGGKSKGLPGNQGATGWKINDVLKVAARVQSELKRAIKKNEVPGLLLNCVEKAEA